LKAIKRYGSIIQSEYELYDFFTNYFKNQGWNIKTCCQKINNHGEIDILGFKNNELLAGEIKTIPSSRVFEQALKHFEFADYIFVGFIGQIPKYSNIYVPNDIGIYSIPKVYGTKVFPNGKQYLYSCIDLDDECKCLQNMQHNYVQNELLKKEYIKKYWDKTINL